MGDLDDLDDLGDLGGGALDAVPTQPTGPWRQFTQSHAPPQLSADELDAARVRQIFRFLAEAEESKTRPVRTLDGAAGTVWFDELPDDDGVEVMTDGVLDPTSRPG
ncbi:hypothetical protein [Streptomyces sp. NPDC054834]